MCDELLNLSFAGVGLYVLHIRPNQKVPSILEISLEKVSLQRVLPFSDQVESTKPFPNQTGSIVI